MLSLSILYIAGVIIVQIKNRTLQPSEIQPHSHSAERKKYKRKPINAKAPSKKASQVRLTIV
jgi:hypothetical protein